MTYFSKEEFFELDEAEKAEYYDRLRLARKEAYSANQKESLAEAFSEISGYYNAEEFASDLKTEAEKQRNSDDKYKMGGKKKGAVIALIFVALAVIVTAAIFISSMSGNKKNKYEKAVSLYEEGKFDEARDIFVSLGSYENSKLFIVAIDSGKNTNSFNGTTIRVGDTVSFGVFEQDNDSETDDGIEWAVLDVVIDEEKGTKRALLMSKNILTVKPYGGDEWKTSSLREWISGDFFAEAFSAAEQDKIVNTLYYEYADKEEKDLIYECSDYVSIPDAAFIDKYASDHVTASAEITETVKSVSEYTSKGEYWLRSFDGNGKSFYITVNGEKNTEGKENSDEIGVRPIMWVKLDGSK